MYAKNERWNDALTNLLKAENLGIDAQEFHMLLGSVYEALNDIDRAGEEYGKAIKDRPDDVYAHLLLGSTLEKAGDYESALSEYNAAIAIAIDYHEAYFHSARMLYKLKRSHEAENV